MSWHRFALAALALALLSGCGFRPMYAESSRGGSDLVPALHTIAVATVRPVDSADARMAQQLRNELLDRLSPQGEPANPDYRLEIVLDSQTSDLLVRRDSTVSRARLSTTATYELKRGETRVKTGSARALTSYALPPEGYFASVVSSRDSERQAAIVMAEQIATALATYFARQRAVAPAQP